MKKFILLIAVITLSFGSVVAQGSERESKTIIGTNSNLANIPFNLASNTATTQHIQLIYPCTLFKSSLSIGSTNPQNVNWEFVDINEIIFFATSNCTIPEADIKFTVSFSILPQNSCFTKTGEAYVFKEVSSPFVVFDNIDDNSIDNCGTMNIDNTNHKITFHSDNLFKYEGNTNGDLLVDIVANIPAVSSGGSNNWLVQTGQSSVLSLYQVDNGTNTSLTALPKTQLTCNRKFSNVEIYHKVNNNTVHGFYDIYTGAKSGLIAELSNFDGTPEKYYFTKQSCYSNNPSTSINDMIETNFIAIPGSVPVPSEILTNREATVKKIHDNRIIYSQITNDLVILFPQSIDTIGISAPNTFNFNVDKSMGSSIFPHIYILFEDRSTPPIIATGANLDNFTVSKNSENLVHICFIQSTTSDYFTGNWNSEVLLKFNTNSSYNDRKWLSYPYQIDLGKEPYGKYDFDLKYANITSVPFNNTKLKIELKTGAANRYGNHDGSFNVAVAFPSKPTITGATDTTGGGTKQFEYKINGISTVNLQPTFYSELTYNDGNPFFDATVNAEHLNSKDIFTNINYLVFRENTSDKSKVPYWRLEDTGSSPVGSKTTNAEIRIEKEISSSGFRYFSVPFNCRVGDITVKATSVAGNSASHNIVFLTEDYNTWGGSNEIYDDRFVVLKYMGSDKTVVTSEGVHEYGHARYEQITDPNAILEPNRGYAFAIFESNPHNTPTLQEVKGLMTIKSQSGSKNLLNRAKVESFDAGSYATHVFDEKDTVQPGQYMPIAEQNQGYKLVGNPYTNYVKVNAYSPNYIVSIDDDYTSATHHHSTKLEDIVIKPFETFFVKLTPSGTTVTITPTDKADPSYSSSSGIPPLNMAQASANDKPEHISVSLSNNNGFKSRTTVINNDQAVSKYDNETDLAEMLGTRASISTYYSNINCAFKELPLRLDSSMTIPLCLKLTQGGNYTIALDTTLTMFWGATMLHDKQNNKYYTLDANGVNFNLNSGTENNRFELVIVPSEIPAELEDVETSETLDAYVHDGRLVVENIAEGSNLSIYDISGKLVYSADASGDFNYNFSARGVYMVVLRGNTTGSIKVVY